MRNGKTPSKVEIHDEKILRKGFLTLQQALLRFEKFDGEMTQPVVRETLIRNDAVAALLYDPDLMEMLFVKQFRYSTMQKKPGWMIECVAGVLKDGETPEQTIHREIWEETGYRTEELNCVLSFFPSPGYSDERIHLFYGTIHRNELEKPASDGEDHAEDIQLVWFTLNEIRELLRKPSLLPAIEDAKTLLALYWWLYQLMFDSSI